MDPALKFCLGGPHLGMVGALGFDPAQFGGEGPLEASADQPSLKPAHSAPSPLLQKPRAH